uniref:GH10 domain-containing protein n=1 Tax=Oryza brachyantha TaxID=4533 RepID=J3KW60_ORYBR
MGSFRVDEPPRCAKVYVHGPPTGVDLKVMDLQVFAVNKIARLRHLRKKTDKVRKRDVVLKLGRQTGGAAIRVVQVENSFPIGACINKTAIQNPAFVDFFTKHFDWAVLENELKWYYTEAVQGQVSYSDADELIAFCDRHGKPVRGHCIFWAVENAVQPWVRALNGDQLRAAVEGRLRSLVSRYGGKFPQYEVNNEMLHGAFFQQRLGDDINAHMFRETARMDPSPALFVNDYNVESANDPNATPERYVELITDLQKRGAAGGGRHRRAGARDAPGGRRDLRRAGQAGGDGAPRVDHGAGRVGGGRGGARRRPGDRAPGGVRAPGRGGHHAVGVHAGQHVALPCPPRRRRREAQPGRPPLRGSPAGVDVARAWPSRRQRPLQVQGLPRQVRGAAHDRRRRDEAPAVRRRQGGRHTRARHGPLASQLHHR